MAKFGYDRLYLRKEGRKEGRRNSTKFGYGRLYLRKEVRRILTKFGYDLYT